MTGKSLFNLSCDIFHNEALTEQSKKFFSDIMPEHGFFFVVNEDRYLQPSGFNLVPASTIWETIKHDTAGIFCHRLEQSEASPDYLVCAAFLGHDINVSGVAAGFLYTDRQSRTGRVERQFYESLAGLKRFYADFISSVAIDTFNNENSLFRYIIAAQDNSIVARRLPASATSNELAMLCDRIVSQNFLKQLSGGWLENRNDVILDSQIKKYKISKFTLSNYEFALLTFELSSQKDDETAEYDTIIRNFSHKVRNQLGALQTAAEQLSTQKEQMVDEDDVSLTDIIQTATEGVNRMVGRLHQFSQTGNPKLVEFDLNEMIWRILRAKTPRPNLRMSFAPVDTQVRVMGDTTQLENALDELLENAIEAARGVGEVKISISEDDNKAFIAIINDIPKSNILSWINDGAVPAEPFSSTVPLRAGMGLSIAKKIIIGHSGQLKIEKNDKNKLLVTIELPKQTERSMALDTTIL
jgi:signal transduction histidine kinase